MRTKAIILCVAALVTSRVARAEEPPKPETELACDANGRNCVRMVKTPPAAAIPPGPRTVAGCDGVADECARTPDDPGPLEPAAPGPQTRNTGLLAAGAVLASLGLASLVAGGIVLSNAAPSPQTPHDEQAVGLGGAIAGFALLVTGGSLVVAGIPMMVVGGLPPKAAPRARGVPSVSIGLRSTSLRWSF